MEAQTSNSVKESFNTSDFADNNNSHKKLDMESIYTIGRNSTIQNRVIVSIVFLFVIAVTNSTSNSDKLFSFMISIFSVLLAYNPIMFFINAIKYNLSKDNYTEVYYNLAFMTAFFFSLTGMLFR